ncbi:MAG: hypothetical protein RBU37_18975 [Myxococcota bacterium]|nr:hypothetical protein [Myxococcota bacterium]
MELDVALHTLTNRSSSAQSKAEAAPVVLAALQKIAHSKSFLQLGTAEEREDAIFTALELYLRRTEALHPTNAGHARALLHRRLNWLLLNQWRRQKRSSTQPLEEAEQGHQPPLPHSSKQTQAEDFRGDLQRFLSYLIALELSPRLRSALQDLLHRMLLGLEWNELAMLFCVNCRTGRLELRCLSCDASFSLRSAAVQASKLSFTREGVHCRVCAEGSIQGECPDCAWSAQLQFSPETLKRDAAALRQAAAAARKAVLSFVEADFADSKLSQDDYERFLELLSSFSN